MYISKTSRISRLIRQHSPARADRTPLIENSIPLATPISLGSITKGAPAIVKTSIHPIMKLDKMLKAIARDLLSGVTAASPPTKAVKRIQVPSNCHLKDTKRKKYFEKEPRICPAKTPEIIVHCIRYSCLLNVFSKGTNQPTSILSLQQTLDRQRRFVEAKQCSGHRKSWPLYLRPWLRRRSSCS